MADSAPTATDQTQSVASQSAGSTSMWDSEQYNLLVWELGQPAEKVFAVRLPKTSNVADLKLEIGLQISFIRHTDLSLWHISMPMDNLPTRLLSINGVEDLPGATLLLPYMSLSSCLGSVLPEHLHIAVKSQLPDEPAAAEAQDTEERRLRLLCQTFWNKQQAKREEIIVQHQAVVPYMSVDGDQASCSDDELQCSFSVMDLGPAFSGIFGLNSSRILIRREYDIVLDILKDRKAGFNRGVVLTGQPGIGKTVFLQYLLVQRILDGLPTAYQTDHRRVFLFLGAEDVRVYTDTKHLDPEIYQGAWALVDSNQDLQVPRSEFVSPNSRFFVVQSTSPQPRRWKSWKKELSASMIVMNPWSWMELYIGGTMIEHPPLNDASLRDVHVKYGGSARHCYFLVRNPLEQANWEKVLRKSPKAIQNLSSMDAIIHGAFDFADLEIPSQMITFIRDEKGQPYVSVVTEYVGNCMYEVALSKDSAQFWQFFDMFRSVPAARSSAGWLWQSHVKHSLCKANHPLHLESLSLPDPTPSSKILIRRSSTHLKLPVSSDVIHGNVDDLAVKLRAHLSERTLFIPGASNHGTFDFFLYSPNQPMTLFQATVAEQPRKQQQHEIKVSGLDFLWDAVKLSGSKSLPTLKKKWRFVFVVPPSTRDKWVSPQHINFGGKIQKRKWENYLEQYVAVLQV